MPQKQPQIIAALSSLQDDGAWLERSPVLDSRAERIVDNEANARDVRRLRFNRGQPPAVNADYFWAESMDASRTEKP